jgi:hypothetical protein
MKADPDLPPDDRNTSSDDQTTFLECCSHLNNERSDDYQEQIGMPDEENMRCWSHHHRTDTVDDPVFRAAMRGYDSVSFIFGLEVTYSLIQQRQQEEDDRQAMKELEGLEELQRIQDEADENDQGASDGDKTSQNRGSACDEDKSNAKTDYINDNQVDEMETEESSPHLSDDDEVESEAAAPNRDEPDSSDAAEGKKETPEAEIVDSPCGSNDSMGVSDAREDSPFLASIQTNEIKEPSASVDVWSCPTCTFANIQSDRKCKVCSSKRPPLGRSKKRPRRG